MVGPQQRIEFVNDSGGDVVISCLAGRTRFAPQGLAGGAPGGLRSVLINGVPVSAKGRYILAPGDRLTTLEAGGGGIGDPRLRDPQALQDDLERLTESRKGIDGLVAGQVEKAYAWGRSQTGRCIRDFIHVTDLAEAHILAANRLAAGSGNLQLNLGSGNRNTVLEVLQAVERATGQPVPVTMSPRRPGDAIALYADTTKVSRELGWKPKLSDIDTVVSTAWAFHRRVWNIDAKAAE